jgi:hypothetical protein
MKYNFLRLYLIVFFVWQGMSVHPAKAAFHFVREYKIVEIENLKGLADQQGDLVIPAVYEDLGWSNQQIDPVSDVIGYRKNGLWGLLNLRNEKVLEPEYTELYPCTDNTFIGSKKPPGGSNFRYGTLNNRGKVLLDFEYADLKPWGSHLIAAVHRGGRPQYGLIDSRGKVIIPHAFPELRALTPDIVGVRDFDNRWTLMNAGGRVAHVTKLDSLHQLNDRYIALYTDGKAGWISRDDGHIQMPAYSAVSTDVEGKLHMRPLRRWFLIDGKNQILDTFRVDDMEPLALNLYKISVGDAEALIDHEENNLTGFKDFDIMMSDGEKALFVNKGKYGVLKLDGAELLPAIYDSIVFLDGYFMVREVLNGKAGWSVLNRYGVRLTDNVYDEILPVETRFFRVRQNGFWGVVNTLGMEILTCKYDTIEGYQNGRFKVNLLGEDGIIDLNGEWVVTPHKKEIDLVDPLRYLVRSRYGSYVYYYPKTIDFRGEFYLYWKGDGFLERTAADKLGWVSPRGRRIIDPVYDEIMPLQEDSIYIARNGHTYSFITRSGAVLSRFDPRFEQVRPMSETFIGVRIDGAWGFVDVNGKLRVANRYEDIGPYTEGMAPIQILGKWGFIDKREVLKVQPKYDRVYPFHEGLSIVVKGGKYGLINKEGGEELAAEYEKIIPLKNGGFIIVRNSKMGLADENGRSRFWPRFDGIMDLGNGSVIVEYKGQYGLMGLDGANTIPTVYDVLKYDPYRKLYLAATMPESFSAK